MFWNSLIEGQPNDVKNFCCLILKQYIYRQRCLKQQLSFQELKTIIFNIRGIEKYIAKQNNRLTKHYNKWGGRESEEIANELCRNYNDYINEYIENMDK